MELPGLAAWTVVGTSAMPTFPSTRSHLGDSIDYLLSNVELLPSPCCLPAVFLPPLLWQAYASAGHPRLP